MKKLCWYLLIVLFLSRCTVVDNSGTYLHENNFGRFELIQGEFEKTQDTIVYFSKTSSFQSKIIIDEQIYPSLFKERICFIDYRKDTCYLFLIEPKTKKRDSLQLPENILKTSWLFEFDNYLIIKDIDKIIMFNSKLGRIESFKIDIESIYIENETEMYFVENNDHQYKKAPTFELRKMNLITKVVEFICTIEESPQSESDATTIGWSGMLTNEKVLFIKTMNSIVALDKTSGRILDKFPEQMITSLQSLDKNKVVFYSDKKITFSMKKQKFS